MKLLHVAAELYPVVRTGGLGDVLAALPGCQRAQGIDARLLIPGYPAVFDALAGVERSVWLGPLFGSRGVRVSLGTIGSDRVPSYVVSAPGLFDRPGNPYLAPDGTDWPDNALRFGLLGWCGAAIARGLVDPDWRADIVQAHDWHAALAPAYVRLARDTLSPPATILTIHNLAFQGLFPPDWLVPLGLPDDAYSPAGLEYWGQMSFMKAGIVYADRVTTVSPTYARDIATPEYGFGLEGVIGTRGRDVRGILNGVDPTRWDPARDPEIASHYDAATLDAKDGNRMALFRDMGLEPGAGPLLGVVSRLSPQKGIDLILEALPRLMACGASLVAIGTGDAELEAALLGAAARYPARVATRIGFSDEMAHRIYAGADAILVPSRFEPCGLTQLYALRYGSPPIVRRTGGLADTVHDIDEAGDAGTGFVFDDESAVALADAVERAAALFKDRPRWRRLQAAGMAERFSWSDAARGYSQLYAELLTVPDAPGVRRPRVKMR